MILFRYKLYTSLQLRLNFKCFQVSMKTYQAILNAGLIFGGALSINPDCRTVDPFIYGAGPLTKYARRFYAENKAHKHYNMTEIGHTLGRGIREKLIEFQGERKKSQTYKCESGPMTVPNYAKPLTTYCRLPGKLHYLIVTRPGEQVPLEVAMGMTTYVSNINKISAGYRLGKSWKKI